MYIYIFFITDTCSGTVFILLIPFHSIFRLKSLSIPILAHTIVSGANLLKTRLHSCVSLMFLPVFLALVEYVELSLISDFIQTVKQFVTRFKKSYINKVVIIIVVVAVEVVVLYTAEFWVDSDGENKL